jgi:hypothetical protein
VAHSDLDEAISAFIPDRERVTFWINLMNDADPIALTESFYTKAAWLPSSSNVQKARTEVATIAVGTVVKLYAGGFLSHLLQNSEYLCTLLRCSSMNPVAHRPQPGEPVDRALRDAD